MSEEKPEYFTDAEEMISTHPTVEIEPPRSVISRRGRDFVEEDKPAFIKFSTGFKKELAEIDEIALKVWIYIALSINRNSGKANPGLRTIAKGTGLAINTIQSALVRLEGKYNLLMVDRESKKYNIYEPIAFVSANRADPSVSAGDTPYADEPPSVSVEPPSVSVLDQSVSVLGPSVSARVILNQRNQRNQSNQKEHARVFIQGIEPAIRQNRPVSEEDLQSSKGGWVGRESMSEPVRELLDIYVNVTGQKPSKGKLMDWLATAQEWLDLGITGADIINAYKSSSPEKGGGFLVTRPGSLTSTAGMFAGKRHVISAPMDTVSRIKSVLAQRR